MKTRGESIAAILGLGVSMIKLQAFGLSVLAVPFVLLAAIGLFLLSIAGGVRLVYKTSEAWLETK